MTHSINDNTMYKTARSPVCSAFDRAFTLFEMLITVTIIILATAVVLPAFGRIIESSNFAGAVNTVTATLGNARALAIQNSEYTAVAFLYDIDSEIYTLLPLELQSEQGASLSFYGTGPNANLLANAYRPARNTVPVMLPKGTAVYGLSFQTMQAGQTIDRGSQLGGDPTLHWYAGEVFENGGDRITPWIFPRNDPRHFMTDGEDPYDVLRDGGSSNEADTAIRHAQSFMIQFSPEGTVVDSVPGAGFTLFNGYIEFPDLPVDESDPNSFDSATGEFIPYDDATTFDPENRPSGISMDAIDENPEVVLRSASLLAVVSLRDLDRGVGIKDAFYVRPTNTFSSNDLAPQRIDLEPTIYYMDENVIEVSDWIDQNAEILGFNRYTGNIIRRSN